MIDFAFTAEQEDFRKELRRFATAELAPTYRERAARGEFCWTAHRQLAELGVLGLGLPEKFGGTGEPDPITLGLATEALAYGDVNVAAASVQVGLVAAQLASQARDAVAERYVPLAEHATQMEAARWLCYRALWLRATGQPHTDLAAMCKWWPPQVAKEAIETAWVTHGNLGYSAESPLQQRYRDVASYLVADGTAAIQKRIIATSLLGKVAAR